MSEQPEKVFPRHPFGGNEMFADADSHEAIATFIHPDTCAEAIHRWNSYPAMMEALEAAVECGMVPSTSVKDGGAAKHSRQVVVADMIRAALAQERGEGEGV